MLRSCIGPTQKDWVSRLPAIEFAINLAQSESTGYSPFFLNTGQMPRVMIWDAPSSDEYLSVRAYAQRMRLALMAVHDALLTARVKQTNGDARARLLWEIWSTYQLKILVSLKELPGNWYPNLWDHIR